MAAVLGGVPAVGLQHGHRWIVFLCIALQVVLITMAISFLVRAKRGGEASGCETPGPVR